MSKKWKSSVRTSYFLYALVLLLTATCILLLAFLLKNGKELRDAEHTMTLLLEEQVQINRQGSEQSRSSMAAELLVLALDAYYEEDTVSFHAYMAVLEGYSQDLSPRSHEIYEKLMDKLS